MMEELSEGVAEKLVGFFSQVRRWETLVAYMSRTAPHTNALPAQSGGAAHEIALALHGAGPECIAALHGLAYPDARNVPKDSDAERVWHQAHHRRLFRLRR
jgi:hypothetical protein